MIIKRADEAQQYEAAGHVGMVPLKYHPKEESPAMALSLGLSKFHPGGTTGYDKRPVEMIYFVLEGELTLRTEEGETRMHKYDSVHFMVDEYREMRNVSNEEASMLVFASFKK